MLEGIFELASRRQSFLAFETCDYPDTESEYGRIYICFSVQCLYDQGLW